MKKSGKIKYVLLGALMTVVCVFSALLITGCDTNKKDYTEVESVPVLTDTRGTEEKIVTFTDMNGREVTYNQNATKIVATSGEGDLVALGIKPVAVTVDAETIAKYKKYFGENVESIPNDFAEEDLMNYHPDLILVNEFYSDEEISQFSEIAPTIPVYFNSTDTEERLTYMAEIFGLEENANKLIQYYDDIKKEAVENIKGLGLEDKTVTIFTYMGGITIPPEFGWYYNKIIYTDFAMKKSQAVTDFLSDMQNLYTPISNEVISNYEGDIVIYSDMSMGEGDLSVPETVSENPGWKNLKAVKENRVGVINATLYAYKDVLYISEQYSGILKAFEVAAPKSK